jgi:ribosomal protein S3
MKILLTPSLNKQYLTAGNVLSRNYSFAKGSNIGSRAMLNAQRRAIKLIDHFFTPIKALSSKPLIEVTTHSVIITVFYYIGQKNRALNNNTINNLGDVLRKLFGRPVELRFVKLHYPYLNRTILAKYIRLSVNTMKFKYVIKKLIKKGPLLKIKNIELMTKEPNQVLPGIQGFKFKVSGRPLTQRVRPRKTILKKQIGKFYKDNKTSFIDYRQFTTKNKRGAYTVKVWISQLLFLNA